MAPKLPDTAELFRESSQAKVTVLAADGSVLAVRGSSGARFVQLDEISPLLVNAVIATEDSRFRHHFGIDPIGLGRALVDNLRAGEVVAGGSTITQQLAKNLYLSPDRDPVRKVREVLIARRLEAELSKQRILELYLNVIEWGDGIYGAEAAARQYFRTSASALTPQEASLLAAGIINPRYFDIGHPSTRLRRRQQMILGRLGLARPPQAPDEKAAPADAVPELPGIPAAPPDALPGEIVPPPAPEGGRAGSERNVRTPATSVSTTATSVSTNISAISSFGSP